jgi:hypothetical protein
MREPLLKLSVEIVFPDGDAEKVEVTSNCWDADGDKMAELFRRLLAAMGFPESVIESIFEDDCDIYSDCTPEVPSAESVEAVSTPAASMCSNCDVDCDTTACLHEPGPISDDDRLW